MCFQASCSPSSLLTRHLFDRGLWTKAHAHRDTGRGPGDQRHASIKLFSEFYNNLCPASSKPPPRPPVSQHDHHVPLELEVVSWSPRWCSLKTGHCAFFETRPQGLFTGFSPDILLNWILMLLQFTLYVMHGRFMQFRIYLLLLCYRYKFSPRANCLWHGKMSRYYRPSPGICQCESGVVKRHTTSHFTMIYYWLDKNESAFIR